MKRTLSQLLSRVVHNQEVEVNPEFRIKVQEACPEKGVRIAVYANNPHHSSDVLEFWVDENQLRSV